MLPLSFQLTSVGFTKTREDARDVIVSASCIYWVLSKVANSVLIQTANPESMCVSCVILHCLRGGESDFITF